MAIDFLQRHDIYRRVHGSMSRFELSSPLPPDQCAELLKAAVGNNWHYREWSRGSQGIEPALGHVSRRSFYVRQRLDSGSRSPFQTVLHGKIIPHGNGTIIRGRAGVDDIIVVFMIVAVVMMLAVWILALANMHGTYAQRVAGALLPPSMLACILGMAWLGRRRAYGEEKFLIEYISVVIQAKPRD